MDILDPVAEAGFESFPASDPPSFTATRHTGEPSRSPRDAQLVAQWQPRFTEVDLTSLPHMGHVHLALLDSGEFLESALNCRSGGPGQPTVGDLADRLLGLRDELGSHRRNILTEGLADQVTTQEPWLLSHLDHLLRHHDELDTAITRAHAEFHGETDMLRATDRIYRRSRGILATLRTMLSVEQSLIMAQFCEPPARD